MIKTRNVKTCIVSACIIVSTLSIPYADENNVKLYNDPAKDAVVDTVIIQPSTATPVSSDDLGSINTQQTKVNDAILEKQKEVDQYLFEKSKEVLIQKGISVTHTVPFDTYVEIGITPYSENSANYLYEEFGKDMIKVVEGQQAYTMELATASSYEPEINEGSKIASFFNNIFEWIKSLF